MFYSEIPGLFFRDKIICKVFSHEHYLNVAAAVLSFKRKLPRWTYKGKILLLLKYCFAIKYIISGCYYAIKTFLCMY